MKKIEKEYYYRNKTIDVFNSETQLDLMLNYKIEKKHWKKICQKMTQKNIKIFIDETYSKGLRKNYPTNKTDVYHVDDTWSLDILDLKDYGPENNRN